MNTLIATEMVWAERNFHFVVTQYAMWQRRCGGIA